MVKHSGEIQGLKTCHHSLLDVMRLPSGKQAVSPETAFAYQHF
jgi:hypothetical protein